MQATANASATNATTADATAAHVQLRCFHWAVQARPTRHTERAGVHCVVQVRNTAQLRAAQRHCALRCGAAEVQCVRRLLHAVPVLAGELRRVLQHEAALRVRGQGELAAGPASSSRGSVMMRLTMLQAEGHTYIMHSRSNQN